MPTPESSRSMQEAERELLALRRRQEAGEAIDLEAICAARPDLASDLRLLGSAYGLEAGSSSLSFRDLVAQELGQGAILTLDLGGDGGAPDAAATALPAHPRYVARDEVGRGGMCRVLSVWDSDLHRHVAMKVALEPSRGAARSAEARDGLARLVAEAHITARLEHPGIVPVHDAGTDREGRAYFTMRLVKGKSFRDVIELARRGQDGWSLTKAVRHLVKICEAVAFAHAKGVVHRDLKPQNVMVGTFGETYVMDWGLARVLGAEDRHAVRLRFDPRVSLSTIESRRTGRTSDDPEDPLVTPAGSIVGTPVFMPPEQARGELERVNQTSDVYALGAMLYTLLAGRPPYVPADGKASSLEILRRVAAGPPPPASAIDPAAPPGLVAICEKAMARRQEDRHRDSLELAAELERFLEPAPAARRTGRRGGAFVLALALAGAGAGGFIAGRTGSRTASDDTVLLADLQRLADFEAEAAELGPPLTAHVPRLEAWLERARRWVEAVRQHGTVPADSASQEARDAAARIRRELDSFTDPGGSRGTVRRVERLLEVARASRKQTVDDVWQLWQEAHAAIADRTRSPAYAGLRLAPQEGLIPLGPDPDSGQWELGHQASGRIPLRDASGRLQLDAGTGIVFALVPGAGGRPASLLARHELTQGQWRRLRGDPPGPGGDAPLTEVSRTELAAVLRAFGMRLPAGAGDGAGLRPELALQEATQ